MFRATYTVPLKINLENFRAIQLGPCGISRYTVYLEAFVTL